MKLATASQMQAIDKAATEKFKIPSLTLMENAGRAVADFVIKNYSKKNLSVSIFSGKGNNAGDGFVAARYLVNAGLKVSLYLISPWTEFSADARINWDRLAGLKISVKELDTESSFKKIVDEIKSTDIIVDALFGTGLTSEIRGRFKLAIDFINHAFKPVIAIDIPSGISADTGEVFGSAVKAKQTITFGLAKVGLFTSTASDYSGKVEIVDIGFPKDLIESTNTGYELITPDIFKKYFKPRAKESHKGTYGHTLVVAGSFGKIGAGLLTSRAALRSGSGLVTYALPEGAYTKFDTKSPEIMYEPILDNKRGIFTKDSISDLKNIISDKSSIAIGPGLGTAGETVFTIKEFIKKVSLPIVIDADGLNCIATDISFLKHKKTPVILTPHPGEMSKLTGLSIKDISAHRIDVAKKLAVATGAITVLKGNKTIVATPIGEIFINPTGNPGMATAGMGDALTGLIAGFIAQNIPAVEATLAAVYIHGMAGDIAATEIGERGIIASDVINLIPRTIKQICS